MLAVFIFFYSLIKCGQAYQFGRRGDRLAGRFWKTPLLLALWIGFGSMMIARPMLGSWDDAVAHGIGVGGGALVYFAAFSWLGQITGRFVRWMRPVATPSEALNEGLK